MTVSPDTLIRPADNVTNATGWAALDTPEAVETIAKAAKSKPFTLKRLLEVREALVVGMSQNGTSYFNDAVKVSLYMENSKLYVGMLRGCTDECKLMHVDETSSYYTYPRVREGDQPGDVHIIRLVA